MERYILPYIKRDLLKKMAFVGGPRQVGKTTLALGLLAQPSEKSKAYFNWDSSIDRKRLLAEQLPVEPQLVVLDEIHKYRKWRNLVKGLYDKNKSSYQFLVTGSARLDYYRRGGDSLQGRYHYYRLHPLSYGELIAANSAPDISRLLEFGGFPEPYFEAQKSHWRRWQKERLTRVIRDDLLGLERVNDISLLELLTEMLPGKVGSPLSIQNIAGDLEVAHKTVKNWLTILENLYYCFRVAPFGSPKIRAVKKEQKMYLCDWSLCEEPGARFENMVASHLLKYCHFIEDTEGYNMELRYIRDTDKREVDFVVLKERKPLFAVECKVADRELSPHLQYFSKRVPIKAWYQVHLGEREYQKDGINFLPFSRLVELLNLP